MATTTGTKKLDKGRLVIYCKRVPNLDEDPGVPSGVPGEGDHAEIARFLLDIRYAIA